MRTLSYYVMRQEVWCVAAGAVVNGMLWIFVYRTFPQDTPAAVLHYTAGVGIDFIGEGRYIVTLPAIGTAVLGVNSSLAWMIRRASSVGLWILLGSIPVVQLILLGAYGMILGYNT